MAFLLTSLRRWAQLCFQGNIIGNTFSLTQIGSVVKKDNRFIYMMITVFTCRLFCDTLQSASRAFLNGVIAVQILHKYFFFPLLDADDVSLI